MGELKTPPLTERPPNTDTYIWSCAVKGRLLVVKHKARVKGLWMCSATVDGSVFVWVDGVRVLRGPIGDHEDCMTSGQGAAIWSVAYDGGSGITVCKFGNPYEKPPVCSRAAIPKPGRPDPTYVAPGVRTRPELLLRVSHSDICKATTPRLLPYPVETHAEDRSLADSMTPGGRYWGSGAEAREAQGILDIDNDGHFDEVIFEPVMRIHGLEPGKTSWRSNKTGKVHAALEISGTASDPLTEAQKYRGVSGRIVTLGGRQYLYLMSRSIHDVDHDIEAIDGASPRATGAITRGLLELRPDGRTTLVCAWGPKHRPEEYFSWDDN